LQKLGSKVLRQNQLQINNDNYLDTYNDYHENYQDNPINPIIEGYFPKENLRKEMAIRKINTTLTITLGIFIMLTAVSYYFATANEIVLNNLSRQTTVLNDENSDLQNKLDKLKSFNNVDMSVQKGNMLKKAQQVIEIPAVTSNVVADKKLSAEKPFSWAIGY
jgi:hypothetical protein